MQTLKKLLSYNSKERKDAVFLTFMIIIMALLDMIGVASILPLLVLQIQILLKQILY